MVIKWDTGSLDYSSDGMGIRAASDSVMGLNRSTSGSRHLSRG